jgi:glycosyltransferase involved in cell wall biosynthesis
LATRHDVTIVGFTSGSEVIPPSFPIRTIEFAWDKPPLYREMGSDDPNVWRPAYEQLNSEIAEPWFVSYLQSAGMEALLGRVSREGFDLIVVHHSNMARFLPAIAPDVPKILNLHNVHALIAERAAAELSGAEAEEARWEAERTRRFERHAASQCELCLVTSEHEADAARRLLGIEHIRVVPNGVDSSRFAPSDGPTTAGYLLFTGTMCYPPNVEAARYFAKAVLPRVRQEEPAARLHIVGAFPVEEVKALASDSVVVHGRVPSMVPYYHEAAVVVVPLLHGGGTRHKILEAAACEKAVVTTTLGVEGLDFTAGKEVVVADTADEFADAVVHLLRAEGERRELGRRARRVARQVEWDEIGTAYCRIVEDVAQQRALATSLEAR